MNKQECGFHDQDGLDVCDNLPSCPAPSPSEPEGEWWAWVGDILQDVEPLGQITYALTDNQMQAILAEQHKRTKESIIVLLTKKRDRYTTEGDPRYHIINSDILAIIDSHEEN